MSKLRIIALAAATLAVSGAFAAANAGYFEDCYWVWTAFGWELVCDYYYY